MENSDLREEGFVVWLTGIPSAGKSTIANRLASRLEESGNRIERLDGDIVRSVIPNIGFSKEEREMHIQRIGYSASLLEKHGVVVVCAFVSPYRESRDFIRGLCKNFIEVYVSTSVEECERRDVKGLYRKARAGEIANLTGLDGAYEVPENPEISIDTEHRDVESCVDEILSYLQQRELM